MLKKIDESKLKLSLVSFIVLSSYQAPLTGLDRESRSELFQPARASNHQAVVSLGHQLVNGALNRRSDRE